MLGGSIGAEHEAMIAAGLWHGEYQGVTSFNDASDISACDCDCASL
jgi:hypothetical protein